ncbi:hypothetical protein NQ317_016188 [Molorchus minor]|uniref:Uncharacterized protein n=1 Tax=Molorchus minor TaxID=1323400 RepID=A0ABQ9J0U2_9CUCU|nr:hypothetical protein NQ317_016188 [Molorchus minor]
MPLMSPSETSPNYLLSPLPFDREKKLPVKLFGERLKSIRPAKRKASKSTIRMINMTMSQVMGTLEANSVKTG